MQIIENFSDSFVSKFAVIKYYILISKRFASFSKLFHSFNYFYFVIILRSLIDKNYLNFSFSFLQLPQEIRIFQTPRVNREVAINTLNGIAFIGLNKNLQKLREILTLKILSYWNSLRWLERHNHTQRSFLRDIYFNPLLRILSLDIRTSARYSTETVIWEKNAFSTQILQVPNHLVLNRSFRFYVSFADLAKCLTIVANLFVDKKCK